MRSFLSLYEYAERRFFPSEVRDAIEASIGKDRTWVLWFRESLAINFLKSRKEVVKLKPIYPRGDGFYCASLLEGRFGASMIPHVTHLGIPVLFSEQLLYVSVSDINYFADLSLLMLKGEDGRRYLQKSTKGILPESDEVESEYRETLTRIGAFLPKFERSKFVTTIPTSQRWFKVC